MESTFNGTIQNYDYYHKKFDVVESKQYIKIQNPFVYNKPVITNNFLPINEMILNSASFSSRPVFSLKVFEFEGRIFMVDPEVFKFTIGFDDGILFVDNDLLHLYSYSDDSTDLITALKRDIAFLYDEYAMADDNELAKDALALKRTLVGSMKVYGHVIPK